MASAGAADAASTSVLVESWLGNCGGLGQPSCQDSSADAPPVRVPTGFFSRSGDNDQDFLTQRMLELDAIGQKNERPVECYHHGLANPSATGNSFVGARDSSKTSVSTPSLPLFGGRIQRSVSSRPVASLSARPAYDGAVLTSVRRQIEAFEDKVGHQISQLRCQQQYDRLREAAFSRLEEKLNAMESLQPRQDQRMAEITGHFKGLSDEMQAQIRRMDFMDDRLCEWRRQTEEDLRQRHVHLEQLVQRIGSGARLTGASSEENHQRLSQRVYKLEADVQERFALQEEICQSITSAWERLQAMESQSWQDSKAAPETSVCTLNKLARSLPSDESTSATQLVLLQQTLTDVVSKVEGIFQDVRDAHASLSTQEEQHKILRTLINAGEENFRALSNRVERGDWDRRLEQLQQTIQEGASQKMAHMERMELMAKRIEYQEQAHDELCSSHWQLMQNVNAAGDLGKQRQQDYKVLSAQANNTSEIAAALEACQVRMVKTENGVSALVLALKEVMPKVVEQQAAIQTLQGVNANAEVHEQMARMEDRLCQLADRIPTSTGVANTTSESTSEATIGCSNVACHQVDGFASCADLRNEMLEASLERIKPLLDGLERLAAQITVNQRATRSIMVDVEKLKIEMQSKVIKRTVSFEDGGLQPILRPAMTLESQMSFHLHPELDEHDDVAGSIVQVCQQLREATASSSEFVTRAVLEEIVKTVRHDVSRLVEDARENETERFRDLTELAQNCQDRAEAAFSEIKSIAAMVRG